MLWITLKYGAIKATGFYNRLRVNECFCSQSAYYRGLQGGGVMISHTSPKSSEFSLFSHVSQSSL